MGDRTVSIPTPVSNEEAEKGQIEWQAYWDAVDKDQRKVAVTTTGCALPLVMLAIALVAII